MTIQHLFRQQALDKLNSPDNLNELLTVTSPKSWLMLLAIALLLSAAGVWGFFATVETTVPGSGMIIESAGSDQPLEAVLFVSIADGRRIRPGMEAKIAPTSIRREEYGMLRATVISVGQVPSSHQEMMEALGIDAVVQSLSAAGSIIEVRLRLLEDEGTPSGYQWTSNQGPPTVLRAGTFSEGTVVIEQVHPINLLFVKR